ncbi:MAG: DinB family protein [Terriglobales bacterium]
MKKVLVVCVLATLVAPCFAQQTKNPVTTVIKEMMAREHKNLVAAIEEMPADKFSFKPTPLQETFGHLAMHITEANNFLCAKAGDVPEPKTEELKDTDSKDKLVSALKASFDFCDGALAKADDSKLGDPVEAFGGRQQPRAWAWIGLASNWADHYAAAAMYLRLNGLLPPTAQPKK